VKWNGQELQKLDDAMNQQKAFGEVAFLAEMEEEKNLIDTLTRRIGFLNWRSKLILRL